MSDIVRLEDIEDKVLIVRGQRVLLDSDVAELYGVETRDVNKSVKNNLDKFPEGYVIELTKNELEDLRWKFFTANLAMTRTMPKAFTEKGLYMLATILKSTAATQATLGIIETFSKHRELARTVRQLSDETEKPQQKALMQRSEELGMQIKWEGQGAEEKGYWSNPLNTSNLTPNTPIVAVDDRYYRPTEVETLLGDPTKAKAKLGWTPKITFDELVAEMVREDLKSAERDELVKKHGYKAMDYHE